MNYSLVSGMPFGVVDQDGVNAIIFDPAKVQDLATYPDPHHYSEGFDHVLVNGQLVVNEGKLTETRPGRILRHTAE